MLPRVLATFLPGETIDIVKNTSKWHGVRSLRFTDGRPALLVPGIEVTVELCRFGSRFGMPIASQDSGSALPAVRRVLHVPLDSSLYQLNQAIQASLGLFAYHHYRFFPAAGPDAECPFMEIYCWDYPPEERYLFFDEHGEPGGAPVPQVSDLAVTLRDVRAKTDFLYYDYDFGDDWTYAVHLGDPVELAGFYCELAEGQGDPPPVDVGGLSGWARFLAAIANPKSKSGREMLEWSQIVLWEPFDLKAMQKRLASLDYLGGEYWARES
ncbi:MAG: plasmid pRiA4b ORF-3 family protein [Clostridiaceae bacterium]|nr:plasmid pRiA4b ORF-3 family protein [Clostridiaceae bacterium]